MAVSKRTRFEVFKRDFFKCQYCGNTPPSIILEVDHVHPRARGGKDNIENLVTSCFDCNRGKSDKLLSSIPQSISETAEKLRERELQLKEYQKLLISIDRRKNKEVNKIESVFTERFSDKCFTDSFKQTIKEKFIDRLTVTELQDAMLVACIRMQTPNRVIKYFCGVVWGKIKNDGREKRKWIKPYG